MQAREFYDKRLTQDPSLGSVQLMEEYAKHIIDINFCDGLSNDFDNMTVEELKEVHNNINLCIDWAHS
jgi:hypothetical protein